MSLGSPGVEPLGIRLGRKAGFWLQNRFGIGKSRAGIRLQFWGGFRPDWRDFRPPKWGRIPAPNSGPDSGPKIGAGFRTKNWGRIPDPELGPDPGPQTLNCYLGAGIQLQFWVRNPPPFLGPESGPNLGPESGLVFGSGIRPHL